MPYYNSKPNGCWLQQKVVKMAYQLVFCETVSICEPCFLIGLRTNSSVAFQSHVNTARGIFEFGHMNSWIGSVPWQIPSSSTLMLVSRGWGDVKGFWLASDKKRCFIRFSIPRRSSGGRMGKVWWPNCWVGVTAAWTIKGCYLSKEKMQHRLPTTQNIQVTSGFWSIQRLLATTLLLNVSDDLPRPIFHRALSCLWWLLGPYSLCNQTIFTKVVFRGDVVGGYACEIIYHFSPKDTCRSIFPKWYLPKHIGWMGVFLGSFLSFIRT